MTTLTTRQLIWSMDDTTAQSLLKLTKRHLSLVKESLSPNTSPERKQAIQADINALRIERDNLIQQYQSNLRGNDYEQN